MNNLMQHLKCFTIQNLWVSFYPFTLDEMNFKSVTDVGSASTKISFSWHSTLRYSDRREFQQCCLGKRLWLKFRVLIFFKKELKS